MIELLQKQRILVSIVLVLIVIATILFSPVYLRFMSIVLLLLSISIAILYIFQKHWESYQKAECTREKMVHNLALDILGLILTIGSAMYIGRLAGGYFGLRSGFWFGLIVGFLGGFVAAWAVRSVWGRLFALA